MPLEFQAVQLISRRRVPQSRAAQQLEQPHRRTSRSNTCTSCRRRQVFLRPPHQFVSLPPPLSRTPSLRLLTRCRPLRKCFPRRTICWSGALHQLQVVAGPLSSSRCLPPERARPPAATATDQYALRGQVAGVLRPTGERTRRTAYIHRYPNCAATRFTRRSGSLCRLEQHRSGWRSPQAMSTTPETAATAASECVTNSTDSTVQYCTVQLQYSHNKTSDMLCQERWVLIISTLQ